MIATLYDKMVMVPDQFTPKELKPYPKDNEIPFEEWFFRYYKYVENAVNNSDRIYLPIQWTAYYCNNRHGKDKRAMRQLQQFIDCLDKSKKYFTVVQYDDGIISDISKLDIKVFGMGCKSSEGTAQLPLVCQPHKYEFKETGRPIFASFIGSITHPIREQMVKELQVKEGYFISTEPTSLHSYCYIMSQSKYVLAPRGYGATSFRIMEAFQYGAIPVYISDEHLVYNSVSDDIICAFSTEEAIAKMHKHYDDAHFIRWSEKKYTQMFFNELFSYEAVANRIYENLQL